MPLPTAAASISAQAFRFMGLDPISSFADDSPQAQAAAEVFGEALRVVLEVAEWSFASRVVQLGPAELADPDDIADPELPHVYVLPSDLLALREVLAIEPRWRIDKGFLRTDQAGPLKIRYTALIDREDLIPATVRQAIALQMAVQMSGRYVQTRTKQVDLRETYAEVLGRALKHDALNASPRDAYGGRWGGWWAEEAVR